MADEFVIKLISDDFAEGVGGGRKGGGEIRGSAFAIGAKLGLGIGIAQKLLSLAMEVIGGVLRPVMRVVKGIFKLVGELLRPVVEILMLIVRPILIMLRPIIQLFRTFMAPFMSIAREFGRIATQQIGKGNLGLAMEASIEGVKALLLPFIISISAVALELASTLIIGTITSLINIIIRGMGDLLQPIFTLLGYGPEFKALVEDITTWVTAQGYILSGNVNALIAEGTAMILEGMEESLRGNLETLKIKAIESEDIVKKATEGMGIDVDKAFGIGGKIPDTFGKALFNMIITTDNFAARLQTAADKINSINIRGRVSKARGVVVRIFNRVVGTFDAVPEEF